MLQASIYCFIACLLQVCVAQSSTASATSSGSNSGSGSNGHSLPIEIVGNKFFFSNGSQFYIKGIAYQADTANSTSDETINDPLADYETCSRDLPYLLDLHTNTIRVYAVNTTLDHSKCMQLLDENGIYVIADLSEPGLSVNRDSPDWTLQLYERYTAVVDVLADYPNVLGFFAGNEVTNNVSNADASPFVKAALRDTKSYIKEKGYRKIPVGYSSNDDGDTRVAIANYFACGDEDEKADFYGINMYEWCGESTFKESGFADRTKEFSNLSIPLFFSEYGCNEVSPRKFTEVGTLYGNDMTDIWSGGIVYMYFQEDNNYGLVEIKDGKVSTLSDFNYLKSELATVSPTSVNKDSYSATSTSLFCPPTNSNWMAAKELPPRPRKDVCDCIKNSVKCTLADSVQEKDYGELFGYLCDKIDCSEIAANGTTGEYGPFAYCDGETKLSYLLNQYYQKNGQSSSACDFSGAASLVSATSAPSSCSAIIASASSDSSGSRSGSSGNSSSSSRGSQGSSTSRAAAAVMAPITNPGLILGGTILTFIFSGFSMLLV